MTWSRATKQGVVLRYCFVFFTLQNDLTMLHQTKVESTQQHRQLCHSDELPCCVNDPVWDKCSVNCWRGCDCAFTLHDTDTYMIIKSIHVQEIWKPGIKQHLNIKTWTEKLSLLYLLVVHLGKDVRCAAWVGCYAGWERVPECCQWCRQVSLLPSLIEYWRGKRIF